MSHCTYQRHAAVSAKPLSPEQSGRTWKLAEILAKAISVFGSKEEAEQWLERPAMGLDQRKPIDLLATPAGVELVEDFLVRLEYGVYARPPARRPRRCRAGRLAVGPNQACEHMG